jgi:abortive infection bacteriophage resistance protein
MARFEKPFLRVAQQISLLCSRGMVITDTAKAESCLARIGYYRLSAYWYPFRQSEQCVDPATGQKKTRVLDTFRPGTNFSDILELYVFDKKMRLLVLDALERVEIAVRTDIALLLGQHSPTAHRDPSLLHGNFAKRLDPKKGLTRHQKWLDGVDNSFGRSKEDFVVHFKNKYADSHLPIWMSVELWNFGQLSHFFEGLTIKDRATISQRYGLRSPDVLETWLHCLNDIRNICAHHARLWNRPRPSQPRLPAREELPELDHLRSLPPGALARLYPGLAILQVLLKVINPTSSWSKRLGEHVATLPKTPVVELARAGFPANWQALPLWK